jgi:AraC-like DNA-binding protein
MEESNMIILMKNYLILSKIEESKRNTTKAFNYYKKYDSLRDSVFNMNILGDINQLQHLYEVSKTNEQIEQLVIEQQIKERTIHYQKIFWLITLCVLLLVSAGLLYIYLQKKDLNKAYQVLFKKNLEIIELNENNSEIHREKYKKMLLNDNQQNALLDKILLLMEDTSIICDTEFTINKLSELVQSNYVYVSHVINNVLKKNFRTFLNEYRMREAQRLIATNANKYTIEAIAQKTGFKSPNAFRYTFKDIVGVTPNFYLKSMQEQETIKIELS